MGTHPIFESDFDCLTDSNMARQGRPGETKMEGELLALTYGAVVARVLKDYERTDEVNAQLDKMGYNIGVRLIDDFLAKNRHGRCKNMQETAEASISFQTVYQRSTSSREMERRPK